MGDDDGWVPFDDDDDDTTSAPTESPTTKATLSPSGSPTTAEPTNAPTTSAPTESPTLKASLSPSDSPTTAELTNAPTTSAPTESPTPKPKPTTDDGCKDSDESFQWNKSKTKNCKWLRKQSDSKLKKLCNKKKEGKKVYDWCPKTCGKVGKGSCAP